MFYLVATSQIVQPWNKSKLKILVSKYTKVNDIQNPFKVCVPGNMCYQGYVVKFISLKVNSSIRNDIWLLLFHNGEMYTPDVNNMVINNIL